MYSKYFSHQIFLVKINICIAINHDKSYTFYLEFQMSCTRYLMPEDGLYGRKHVACVDGVNKIGCGRRRWVY
jgi:hypothetical protein